MRFFLIHCEVILLKRIGDDEDEGRKLALSMFLAFFFLLLPCKLSMMFQILEQLVENSPFNVGLCGISKSFIQTLEL